MTTYGSLYKRFVNIDLFTDSYRVSGRVPIGAAGLFADLDNPTSDLLELQDAYVSRIHEPGEIIASYSMAAFRKENINFIVMQDRRDGIPVGTQHGKSVFTRGKPTHVFITVPSFELTGQVMFEGQIAPNKLLVQSHGGYLMLFEGRALASHQPDVTYNGDLIMVHKERAGILCLQSQRQ